MYLKSKSILRLAVSIKVIQMTQPHQNGIKPAVLQRQRTLQKKHQRNTIRVGKKQTAV